MEITLWTGSTTTCRRKSPRQISACTKDVRAISVSPDFSIRGPSERNGNETIIFALVQRTSRRKTRSLTLLRCRFPEIWFVGPEPASDWRAVDLSGRKTSNRTSIVLPRWFVDDGPTGWIASVSRRFAHTPGGLL